MGPAVQMMGGKFEYGATTKKLEEVYDRALDPRGAVGTASGESRAATEIDYDNEAMVERARQRDARLSMLTTIPGISMVDK